MISRFVMPQLSTRWHLGLSMLLLATVSPASLALEKWGPTWSEITGQRYTRTTMNRLPAIIKSVDGRDTTFRIVKVEPGERKIRVQSPSRKGFMGRDQELVLVLKPCTRVYINAQFDSSVGPEWKPVVDKTESIAGCKTPKA